MLSTSCSLLRRGRKTSGPRTGPNVNLPKTSRTPLNYTTRIYARREWLLWEILVFGTIYSEIVKSWWRYNDLWGPGSGPSKLPITYAILTFYCTSSSSAPLVWVRTFISSVTRIDSCYLVFYFLAELQLHHKCKILYDFFPLFIHMIESVDKYYNFYYKFFNKL